MMGQFEVVPAAAPPAPGFARPKGATPLRVSLVPAYEPCTSPNREHGPPLAFPSCGPPVQASDHLTVGTPDANGRAGELGRLRAAQRRSSAIPPRRRTRPTSSVDGRASATCATRPRSPTTRASCWRGSRAASPTATTATRRARPRPWPTSRSRCRCRARRPPIPATGGSCTVNTSLDALLPGSVREGKRAIWQLDGVEVYDGGRGRRRRHVAGQHAVRDAGRLRALSRGG